MIRVISWNNGESARAISQAVSNGKLLSTTSTRNIPATDVLVNLGCSTISRPLGGVELMLNPPSTVARASNKQRFFAALANDYRISCVPSYTDKRDAIFGAIQHNAGLVIRHTVNGHGGEGIQVITADEMQTVRDIPDAPLYTLLIKKRREYRVHVAKQSNGSHVLLDITRKIHRDGIPIAERGHVWNHDNGYIFTRDSILRDWTSHSTLIQRMYVSCVRALSALRLDFAAFDVVVEAGSRLEDAKVYILEANTAPGMEGFTLKRYCEYFQSIDGGPRLQDFHAALSEYMRQPNEEVQVSEE